MPPPVEPALVEKLHRKQQPQAGEIGPGAEVGGGQTQGRGHGNHAEAGVAQGAGEVVVDAARPEQQAQHQATAQHIGEEPADLRVQAVRAQGAAPQGHEMHGEVEPGDQGEDFRDQFQGQGFEEAEAGIVGGKPSQPHDREGVDEGIAGRHAEQPVQADAEQGEQDVDLPQALGGFGHARRQLVVLHGARRLRLEHLAPPHAQQRQHRHHQHDHAQAAQPVQLGAPHVDGGRQLVQA
jgi:hypothetical protein